jgi:hypothetical protein
MGEWGNGGNASAYRAGGLTSRKPQKNKAVKKPILKLYFLHLFFFFFSSYGTKSLKNLYFQ